MEPSQRNGYERWLDSSPRVRNVALICVFLLIAGCTGTQRPTVPAEAPGAWTNPTSHPWIAVTGGCGFCSGNMDVPEIETTTVYASGHVLWFRFGMAGSEGQGDLMFKRGLEPYESAIRTLIPRLDNGYVTDRDLKIHEAHGGIVASADWKRIRTAYEQAVGAAVDPGPPDLSRCADAAATPAQLFGDNAMAVELAGSHCGGANYHPDDPWDWILRQTGFLREWITTS